MMSALYLRGLKHGDRQMTATGLLSAGLFFFLSQTKPLLQIAPERPPATVFHRSVSLSILGQFIVHFVSLLAILRVSEKYIAPDDSTLAPDGAFQPNIINTSMFLLSVVMQTNNFIVNYRGHPFTQSIGDNFALWRSIQAVYAVIVIAVGGQFEPLNDLLQLTSFPDPQFQIYLLVILGFNFAATWSIEKFCQRLA
jgi:cation-transporting ATPase 13A1